jgi:hypothetical protein
MKHLAKHRSKISLPLYAVHGTKDAVTSLDVSVAASRLRAGSTAWAPSNLWRNKLPQTSGKCISRAHSRVG